MNTPVQNATPPCRLRINANASWKPPLMQPQDGIEPEEHAPEVVGHERVGSDPSGGDWRPWGRAGRKRECYAGRMTRRPARATPFFTAPEHELVRRGAPEKGYPKLLPASGER